MLQPTVAPTHADDPFISAFKDGNSSILAGFFVGVCAFLILVFVVIWKRRKRAQKESAVKFAAAQRKSVDLPDQDARELNGSGHFADVSCCCVVIP